MASLIRASIRQPRPRGLRLMLLGAVALGALLLGVLFMHSGATSLSTPAPAALSAATADTTMLVGAADSATLASTSVLAASATCGQFCAPDCAFMAMMCVLLLTLASMLLLATSPATFRRLLESGRRSLTFLADTAIPALRPNLVVLSISRT